MIARLMFKLGVAVCMALAAPLSGAAEPPSRYAFELAPAERFDVGATLVERHGNGPRALVFIPGLASGAWAWQEGVRRFKDKYTVYVLTFPGFAGRPAVPGQTLDAARASIMKLIESRKLVRPVLIGHSLGGSLALLVAAQRPELVKGVVALDGLPVFPGTEDIPTGQRARMGDNMTRQMAALSPQAFALSQQQYMRSIGSTDIVRADELAKLSAQSDPAAVARYMAELFALDLRSELPKISAPVLVLSPYFSVDAQQQMMTEAAKTAYYKAIMEGTPQLTVQSIPDARHFAMFDAPDAVMSAIADFVGKH
ncbi:MAG: alpha/beta fold hydrolase [Gammaproteobacteria bacterium]